MAAEYVELTKEDFEEGIFKKYDLGAEPYENHRSQEYQYLLRTSHPIVKIMVYSSVDKRTNKTRGVGEDAIRLVLWNSKDNRPLGKGKRVYRVTSKDSISLRIIAAIGNFLETAPNVSIIDWDYVRGVLNETVKISTNSTFASNLLDGLNRFGSLTDKQLEYVLGETSPKGYPTMEAKLKSKGWVYDPTYVEVEVQEREPGADENEDETGASVSPSMEVPEVTGSNGNGGDYTDGEERQNQPSKYDDIPLIRDTPGMALTPTTGYPYRFPTFNPVQTLVYPFKDTDCNLIIGASTSAGKTICAELIMNEVLGSGKRVVYLSPLKSLTQEKYDDWKVRFSEYKITILTGDYTLSDQKKAELGASPIIVMTSEMTDSRTRRMESENNYWLKEVGLVIVDESHILSTSRGHAVESGIMRFTSINKMARVLFLSATMPNVDQLGAWLRTLNGKETKVIYSTWRPVSLQFHYREYPIVRNRFGGESYQASQEAKKSIAIEIVKSKPTEKFLVFTHDKGTGRDLVRRLKEEGIESQFHNADLDLTERLDVEALFTKREGGLRVLISTSTLAWGRNLPARNVVVVGVHRGLNEVDELDIIQMSGRAGRYGIDDEGHVYLIIPEMTTESWKEVFRNPRPVTSVLKTHQVLAFHVLAEIQNKVVVDARSLLAWYSRSLAYFQGENFTINDAGGLLDDLEKMEMVINKGTHYVLTGLGKVSGWLYFSPYDVYAWYKNFDLLFRGKEGVLPIMDDITISWALTDIPSNDWGYVPKEVNDMAEEMRWKLNNRGIMASDAIHFALAAQKLLSGDEIDLGVLKAGARAIKYDIQRTTQALGLIDYYHGRWGKEGFWKILPIRINYGIPEEMLELVRLPGIGGAKAKKMWAKGIKNLEDIINKTEEMKSIFVPVFIKKLQSDAKKLLSTGEQKDLRSSAN